MKAILLGMERNSISGAIAMLIFGLGGGMATYEGLTHLWHPREMGDPLWSYVVLGIAFIAEGNQDASPPGLCDSTVQNEHIFLILG
jgi:hypothetical protein